MLDTRHGSRAENSPTLVSLEEARETQDDGGGEDPAHDDEDHTPCSFFVANWWQQSKPFPIK